MVLNKGGVGWCGGDEGGRAGVESGVLERVKGGGSMIIEVRGS